MSAPNYQVGDVVETRAATRANVLAKYIGVTLTVIEVSSVDGIVRTSDGSLWMSRQDGGYCLAYAPLAGPRNIKGFVLPGWEGSPAHQKGTEELRRMGSAIDYLKILAK